MTSGGGPYDTIPWPSEIVPGLDRIHSPRMGMTGGWMSVMRRGRCTPPYHQNLKVTPAVARQKSKSGSGRSNPTELVHVIEREVAHGPEVAHVGADAERRRREQVDPAAVVHPERLSAQAQRRSDRGDVEVARGPDEPEAPRRIRLHRSRRKPHDDVDHPRRDAGLEVHERAEDVRLADEVRPNSPSKPTTPPSEMPTPVGRTCRCSRRGSLRRQTA